MADTKIYTSVSEIVREMSPDREFSDDFEDRVARQRLIKHLLVTRAIRGFSQQDIAKSLGCTQSRVSKLESLDDDELRVGDLRSYAKTVGLEFTAGFVPHDMNPVDKVKCHVFTIKKHMDDLALLARTDEKIAEGAGGFFFELFTNFVRLVGDSAKLLPHRSDDSPYFSVLVGEECKESPEKPMPCCRTSSKVLAASL